MIKLSLSALALLAAVESNPVSHINPYAPQATNTYNSRVGSQRVVAIGMCPIIWTRCDTPPGW